MNSNVSTVSELSFDRLSLTTKPAALKFWSLFTLVAGIGIKLESYLTELGMHIRISFPE